MITVTKEKKGHQRAKTRFPPFNTSKTQGAPSSILSVSEWSIVFEEARQKCSDPGRTPSEPQRRFVGSDAGISQWVSRVWR